MKRLILLLFLIIAGRAFSQETSTFTDPRDGHTYKIVKIGNQWWFAENLNYKTDNSWAYNNDESLAKEYGRLYTWESAQTACPDGWHIPSNDEWDAMVDAIGGETEAAIKLKSTGSDWQDSNQAGQNTVGFNAFPAGYRDLDGSFKDMGQIAAFWTATENGDLAWRRYLIYSRGVISRGNDNKGFGYSVRCVKDQ